MYVSMTTLGFRPPNRGELGEWSSAGNVRCLTLLSFFPACFGSVYASVALFLTNFFSTFFLIPLIYISISKWPIRRPNLCKYFYNACPFILSDLDQNYPNNVSVTAGFAVHKACTKKKNSRPNLSNVTCKFKKVR